MYIHVRSLLLLLFVTLVLFCSQPFTNPAFAQEQVPHSVSAERQASLPAMTSVPPSSIFKLDNGCWARQSPSAATGSPAAFPITATTATSFCTGVWPPMPLGNTTRKIVATNDPTVVANTRGLARTSPWTAIRWPSVPRPPNSRPIARALSMCTGSWATLGSRRQPCCQ